MKINFVMLVGPFRSPGLLLCAAPLLRGHPQAQAGGAIAASEAPGLRGLHHGEPGAGGAHELEPGCAVPDAGVSVGRRPVHLPGLLHPGKW
jgi:hypothetical protein